MPNIPTSRYVVNGEFGRAGTRTATAIGMQFTALPPSAAWRHQDARQGFESMFARPDGGGYRLEGHSAAVEAGQAWVVRYVIWVDAAWITRAAQVWAWSQSGSREIRLTADGAGHWRVDDAVVPGLDGCLDVDLESSACTNTLPVHRLKLGVGQSAQSPAAYVRALDLRVERLEQHYARVDDAGAHQCYAYRAPVFNFESRLVYDESGLVLDYPGIASRVL